MVLRHVIKKALRWLWPIQLHFLFVVFYIYSIIMICLLLLAFGPTNFISKETHASSEDLRQYKSARNLHNFSYVMHPDPCTAKTELLLSVHSRASYSERRRLLRATWAAPSLMFNITGLKTKILFVLGADPSLDAAVYREANTYNDILQINFIDHYENNTYKALYHFRWVHENCRGVKIVMKTDDDMLMHPDKLRHMFTEVKSQLSKSNRLYLGKMTKKTPFRDSRSKWFVPWHVYPFTVYPRFSYGGCYFLTPHITKDLFEASRTTPYLFIDDVYLGVLIHKIENVKIFSLGKYFPWLNSQGIQIRTTKDLLNSWQGYNNIAVYHMPDMDKFKILWKSWTVQSHVVPPWNLLMYFRYLYSEIKWYFSNV